MNLTTHDVCNLLYDADVSYSLGDSQLGGSKPFDFDDYPPQLHELIALFVNDEINLHTALYLFNYPGAIISGEMLEAANSLFNHAFESKWGVDPIPQEFAELIEKWLNAEIHLSDALVTIMHAAK